MKENVNRSLKSGNAGIMLYLFLFLFCYYLISNDK